MLATSMAALTATVSVLIVMFLSWASRRAGYIGAVLLPAALAIQWLLAASGTLHDWTSVPPPVVLVALSMAVLATVVALSPVGAKVLSAVPASVLVGYQGFRLPLELVMHQAAVDGVMPVQMSYSGWNFDIVTGATALVVGTLIAIGRAPTWLLVAWNALGTVLLANVVTIAVLSTPTFAAFGPDHLNTWIADPPYVWLPGLLVPAALFGHVLLWRRIAGRR